MMKYASLTRLRIGGADSDIGGTSINVKHLSLTMTSAVTEPRNLPYSDYKMNVGHTRLIKAMI